MENCIFCNIAKSNTPHHEILWRSDEHIAFLDINPSKPGHTLVIPKRHSANVNELTEEEYESLFNTCRTVSNILKKKIPADLIAIVVEGMSVPHTHVHLIPLKNGEKLAQFENHRATSTELKEIADKIRF